MDRDIKDPIELLDEIESILKINCAPITWPIGMGQHFKGVYHIANDCFILYNKGQGSTLSEQIIIQGIDSDEAAEALGQDLDILKDELELVMGASHEFEVEAFLNGDLTPVFFGTALGNFGVDHILDMLCANAPAPLLRETHERKVMPTEQKMTGFVFKIQANMDPKHRDRVAFMRICSGQYQKGIKLKHVRLGKDVRISDALTFLAGERAHLDQAVAGDIIGLHNHGTIQIGDTFTEGESLNFKGIPNFAPELFRLVRLNDPLKSKQLLKGIKQLSEEGAMQVFMPLKNNDIIVGAVGVLQFDVVAQRLKAEYNVDCKYESVSLATARWVFSDDEKAMDEFKRKCHDYLALDGGDYLTYLAPTGVNLSMAMERYPKIQFNQTREHAGH